MKLIHGNTCVERVLYNKRHQNTYIEKERATERARIFPLGCYATFVVWALTFGTVYRSHFQGSRCQGGHSDPYYYYYYSVGATTIGGFWPALRFR
jgi:hypothetical protein